MRTFIVLAILLHSLAAVAQQPDENTKRQLVTLSLPETTVKAEVRKKPAQVQPNDQLTYHWYKSNQILSTQGGYEGKLLDGSYTSFYVNKNLQEQGRFKLGLKNGEWKRWHENGRLEEWAFYNKGKLNGRVRTYNDQGELLAETHFRDGVKHGTETTYVDGKADQEEEFRQGKSWSPRTGRMRWMNPVNWFRKKETPLTIEPILPSEEQDEEIAPDAETAPPKPAKEPKTPKAAKEPKQPKAPKAAKERKKPAKESQNEPAKDAASPEKQ